jgi:hypothetical protein
MYSKAPKSTHLFVEKGRIRSAAEARIHFQAWAASMISSLTKAGNEYSEPSLVLAAHPWIAQDGVASDRPLDSAVLQRLKQFSAANKLKRVALKVRLPFVFTPCTQINMKQMHLVAFGSV